MKVGLTAATVAILLPGTSHAQSTSPVGRELLDTYAQIPELTQVEASADAGVVKLRGEVDTRADAKLARQLAERHSGIIHVVDNIRVVNDVDEKFEDSLSDIKARFRIMTERAPVFGLAFVTFIPFLAISRLFFRSERILRRVVRKRLVREVLRRLIGIAILGVGTVVALEIVEATAFVGALLGAAGIASIALGFAFRDIAENYLASILLSFRRPYARDDVVVVGGHEGRVVSMTLRETILMTYEGNHVRLPNATIFKSSMVNLTRNSRRRFSFEVGIGVQSPIAHAQRVGVQALENIPGILGDPPPFSRVEALGESNVVLSFFAWIDQSDSDWFRAKSEAIRMVKVSLDDHKIEMPEPIYRVNLRDHLKEAGVTDTRVKGAAEFASEERKAGSIRDENHFDKEIDRARSHEEDLL